MSIFIGLKDKMLSIMSLEAKHDIVMKDVIYVYLFQLKTLIMRLIYLSSDYLNEYNGFSNVLHLFQLKTLIMRLIYLSSDYLNEYNGFSNVLHLKLR